MTEIEKARLDLKTSVSLLQLERGEHEAYRSERTVSTIEALIDAKLAEHANRIRAIAREEIEAAKGGLIYKNEYHPDMPRTVTDADVAAVTTPATGASGFAIAGTPFNQEGGDPHSTGISDRSDPAEDKSPPAVEAPAAGDCPYCNGSGLFLGGRLSVTPPKCPRCYGSGQAEDVGPRNAVEADRKPAGMSLAQFLAKHQRAYREWMEANGYVPDADTTALARQLAEALRTSMHDGPLEAEHYREIAAALTEARKRGLIE